MWAMLAITNESSQDEQGGVVRWRKFDFKRVNPSKTPFGGSSGRYRLRTLSRK
jgi:hypothetical protein